MADGHAATLYPRPAGPCWSSHHAEHAVSLGVLERKRMQQEIVTHLADPRFVAEVVEMLTATEQTALNDILAQGIIVSYTYGSCR